MATPSYSDVISQINTFIVANGNNEITANVLNPILEIITDFANNHMGDLDNLTTDQTDTLVDAINSLKQNINDIVGNSVQLHVGNANPNDEPPLLYNYGDFYMQLSPLDNDPIQLWQFNGFEWFAPDAATSWGDIEGNIADQTDLQDALDLKADVTDLEDYQLLSEKGEANGYTPLDSGAKVPIEFLPDSFINVKDYGVAGDGTTDDQAAIDALMANTNYSFFYFPKGVYRTYINNTISNRTFLFEEGAIIDGVVHIAVGTGVDYNYNGISNEIVENTRVIGTLVSTVRVGTYYCKNLNIDKIRITDVDPSYINQTIEGGSRGVHFFMASKNINVDEIIIESTTVSHYALGIDNHLTDDDIHYPENITINKLTINNNILAGILTRNTRNLFINTVIINSYDNTHGISHNGDLGLKFGNIKVDGINTTGVSEGVYILNSDVTYGNLEVINSTKIGLRITENSNVKIDRLISKNHVSEAVLSDGDFICNYIECSNSNYGLVLGNYDKNVIIDNVYSHNNTVYNIVVNGANKIIKNIKADTSGSFGVVINATATNFYNEFLQSSNATQGLRCLSNDLTLGDIRLIDNEIGFQGSGIDKLSYKTIYYNNNSTYDTNTELDKVSNFKGRLYIPNTDSPYKVYTALISQSGTDDPTATVLENTTGGTVAWTRATTGQYSATFTGVTLVQTKTAIFCSNGFDTGVIILSSYWANSNTINLYLRNASNTTVDGLLRMNFEIRVYP